MTTIDGARSATDEFLVKAGRFFTPGRVSSDLRTVTKVGDRTAWVLSANYQTGKHVLNGMYAKANKDKVLVGETGAKNYSISYAYLFSARTSIGVGYAVMKNDALGTYTLAGDTSTGTAAAPTTSGYSSGNAEAFAGEKQTYLGVSLRQSF